MNPQDLDAKLDELMKGQREYPISYPLILLGILLTVLILVGFERIAHFGESVYTEAISIILTVGIIDVLNRHREKQKEDRVHRILNANNGKAFERPDGHKVFFEMMIRGLLKGHKTTHFDISGFKAIGFDMKKCNLQFFNMTNSEWNRVDFSNSRFDWVDLSEATFSNCRLDNCYMAGRIQEVQLANVTIRETTIRANADFAKVFHCDLKDCDFSKSTLRNAYFSSANLSGVNFTSTDLTNAIFSDCTFDSNTILPNGSRYDIKVGIEQLNEFCDTSHVKYSSKYYSGYSMLSIPHTDEWNNKNQPFT